MGDRTAINHAIEALNNRIEKLRATKHEWDPKAKMQRQQSVQQQQQAQQSVQPQSVNAQLSEEERQLQEVLRISQEQHVRDMRMRQQRELDAHASRTRLRQQQSVKMYSVHEEQDHKAWQQ